VSIPSALLSPTSLVRLHSPHHPAQRTTLENQSAEYLSERTSLARVIKAFKGNATRNSPRHCVLHGDM